jgi:hypothetical protein
MTLAIRLRATLALAAALACSGLRASAASLAAALGEPASITDSYRVSCSDDGSGAPASLALRVTDTEDSGSARVGVQGRKAFAVTNSVDLSAADALPSPEVAVNRGARSYDVPVDKTGSGATTYTLFFECRTGANGAGVPTGTAISVLQNQVPALPPLALVGALAGVALAGVALAARALAPRLSIAPWSERARGCARRLARRGRRARVGAYARRLARRGCHSDRLSPGDLLERQQRPARIADRRADRHGHRGRRDRERSRAQGKSRFVD